MATRGQYSKMDFSSKEKLYRAAVIASIDRILLRSKARASLHIKKNPDPSRPFKAKATPGVVTNRLGVLAAGFNEGREQVLNKDVAQAASLAVPNWGSTRTKRMTFRHYKHRTIGATINQTQTNVIGRLIPSVKNNSPAIKRLEEYYNRRLEKTNLSRLERMNVNSLVRNGSKRAVIERMRHDKKGRPFVTTEFNIQVKKFSEWFGKSLADVKSEGGFNVELHF
jgi:hypothetical protein